MLCRKFIFFTANKLPVICNKDYLIIFVEESRISAKSSSHFDDSPCPPERGAQREEEEEARGRTKAGSTGPPTPSADAPTG